MGQEGDLLLSEALFPQSQGLVELDLPELLTVSKTAHKGLDLPRRRAGTPLALRSNSGHIETHFASTRASAKNRPTGLHQTLNCDFLLAKSVK